jgi:YidC/Oxa1 family membrane protein insertase
MKLLMIPLILWSQRGLTFNQELSARIAPQIAEIKASYRGEEQSERILQLYKASGYNPFLPLKSLFVLILQIPIFISVFLSITSDNRFTGESFFLIAELTQPDALIVIMDQSINFLPIVMLSVSITNILVINISQKSRTENTYVSWSIAIFFFIALYGAPAALVIYWSTNIALQTVIDLIIIRRDNVSTVKVSRTKAQRQN